MKRCEVQTEHRSCILNKAGVRKAHRFETDQMRTVPDRKGVGILL